MTLVRRTHESQRKFVERVLREDGRIAVYDVLYGAEFEDGRKTSVTRLAAIIHTLRQDGWRIDTEDASGHVAVYVLRSSRPTPLPVPQEPVWRCLQCAGRPAYEPAALLGGMGESWCMGCGRRTKFARRAA